MKQGDYVKWIYDPHDERAIAKGIILKRIIDGRYKILLRSGSIQYFKESELRIIQATD
tara:strand:+ start:108 stop:281 length:174 start_codon:yes stop_codon:yes gene_type:complete